MPYFNDKPVVLATNVAANAYPVRMYLEPAGTYELAKNLFDGHTATFDEAPSVSSSGTIPTYIKLQIPLGGQSFDTIIFHGEFAGATSIKVYADSELLWSGTDSSRMAVLTGSKSASYIYIEVSGEGVFKFYQTWVGNRIELPNKGTRPYDASKTTSSTTEFVSDSGAITRYVFYSGRLELDFKFTIDSDAAAQKYSSLFRQSGYGSRPIYWIEDPDSHPEKPMLSFIDGDFGITYTGPNRRGTEITLLEQGPRFLSMES